MKPALLAVLLSACGPTAAVVTHFAGRPLTAAQLRATWGEPCTVEQLSAGEERWTYCVTFEGSTEVWAECRPGCEPAHSVRIAGGFIVADEPPSP